MKATMNRPACLLAIALAVSGCTAAGRMPGPTATASPAIATQTPAATPVDYPCDGRRWNQAESITDGTADGIQITIAPTDRALFPCQQFGDLMGYSAVFANLAHYPREGHLGGEMIQFGIIYYSGQHAAIVYTPDNTGGGDLVELLRPKPGVTYTLTIALNEDTSTWDFEARDNQGNDWIAAEPAHWLDPQSAWVMADTFDHSLVRGITASALSLAYTGIFRPSAFPACSVIAGATGGSGRYITRPAASFSCVGGDRLEISSSPDP